MRDPERGTPAPARPVVVTMPAEIDISNADRVGEELCAALAPGVTTVVADMTGTRFCDSTGISMLVLAHRKALANNAELRLVAMSTAVLRALTLVRIDHFLRVYPNVADALRPGPLPEPTDRLSGRRMGTEDDVHGRASSPAAHPWPRPPRRRPDICHERRRLVMTRPPQAADRGARRTF
jgi:anti-sigma B factor antagonist